MELMPFYDTSDEVFKFIFPRTGDIAHDTKGEWYYSRGHWYFSAFPEGKTGEWIYRDNEWRFGRWCCTGAGWHIDDQEPFDQDDPEPDYIPYRDTPTPDDQEHDPLNFIDNDGDWYYINGEWTFGKWFFNFVWEFEPRDTDQVYDPLDYPMYEDYDDPRDIDY